MEFPGINKHNDIYTTKEALQASRLARHDLEHSLKLQKRPKVLDQ